MIIKHYFFIGLFFISAYAGAQTVRQLIKAGDQKVADADYYAASLYYADALKKDEMNTELYYKLGEARRMFNDYGGAAEAYNSVVSLDKANLYPLASFWLGEMLRGVCTCKTEEAMKQLKKFKNRYHK